MGISVTAYKSDHEPAVRDFNARQAAASSGWSFYESSKPDWLAPGLSASVQRNGYVALDDAGAVRGAYTLKPQRFLLRGEPVTIAAVQGPISEGLIDPRYFALAFMLVRDMEEREPNLFGWGPGDRIREALVEMDWFEFKTPMLLRLRQVGRFLRGATFFRKSAKARAALDLLALTGAGAIGARLAQAGQALAAGGASVGRFEVVECDRFGDWADQIWEAAKDAYPLIAWRDREAMNALFPATGWPQAQILQVKADGRTVGWAAARDHRFKDDARFGDLYVGSILDSLALPGHEAKVIRAATAWLEGKSVDAIYSTYTHPSWIAAFRASGFMVSPGRRVFIGNETLGNLLGNAPEVLAHAHLAPVDGDGPRGL